MAIKFKRIVVLSNPHHLGGDFCVIIVIVKSFINLNINDPTKNTSSNSVSWQVRGNEKNYRIEFASEEIKAVKKVKNDQIFLNYKKEDKSINYKSYFKYSFSDDPNHSFAPGESKTVKIKKGELSIN